MTGVPVSAEGPSHPSSFGGEMNESFVNPPSPESPSALLERAADLIEQRANLAVIGPWEDMYQRVVAGPEGAWDVADCHTSTATTSSCSHGFPRCRTSPGTSIWIAAMDPDMASPLVDWLLAEARFVRRNYTAMHGQVEHLPSMRFARQVLHLESS